jgi:hypothetical protein
MSASKERRSVTVARIRGASEEVADYIDMRLRAGAVTAFAVVLLVSSASMHWVEIGDDPYHLYDWTIYWVSSNRVFGVCLMLTAGLATLAAAVPRVSTAALVLVGVAASAIAGARVVMSILNAAEEGKAVDDWTPAPAIAGIGLLLLAVLYTLPAWRGWPLRYAR